ncbi:MAG: hypothetical protein ABEH35_04785 [Haloarculaceae archaeon]
MDAVRTVEWLAVGLICLLLLASGPLVGGGVPERVPSEVGDGNATVTVESFPADQFRIDRGRFGTNVSYLRIPDIHLFVASVRGTPRLVYRIELPALGVDRVATDILTSRARGDRRLTAQDRAIPYRDLDNETYRATVTVRVQSFDVNYDLVRRNVTVEVET